MDRVRSLGRRRTLPDPPTFGDEDYAVAAAAGIGIQEGDDDNFRWNTEVSKKNKKSSRAHGKKQKTPQSSQLRRSRSLGAIKATGAKTKSARRGSTRSRSREKRRMRSKSPRGRGRFSALLLDSRKSRNAPPSFESAMAREASALPSKVIAVPKKNKDAESVLTDERNFHRDNTDMFTITSEVSALSMGTAGREFWGWQTNRKISAARHAQNKLAAGNKKSRLDAKISKSSRGSGSKRSSARFGSGKSGGGTTTIINQLKKLETVREISSDMADASGNNGSGLGTPATSPTSSPDRSSVSSRKSVQRTGTAHVVSPDPPAFRTPPRDAKKKTTSARTSPMTPNMPRTPKTAKRTSSSSGKVAVLSDHSPDLLKLSDNFDADIGGVATTSTNEKKQGRKDYNDDDDDDDATIITRGASPPRIARSSLGPFESSAFEEFAPRPYQQRPQPPPFFPQDLTPPPKPTLLPKRSNTIVERRSRTTYDMPISTSMTSKQKLLQEQELTRDVSKDSTTTPDNSRGLFDLPSYDSNENSLLQDAYMAAYETALAEASRSYNKVTSSPVKSNGTSHIKGVDTSPVKSNDGTEETADTSAGGSPVRSDPDRYDKDGAAEKDKSLKSGIKKFMRMSSLKRIGSKRNLKGDGEDIGRSFPAAKNTEGSSFDEDEQAERQMAINTRAREEVTNEDGTDDGSDDYTEEFDVIHELLDEKKAQPGMSRSNTYDDMASTETRSKGGKSEKTTGGIGSLFGDLLGFDPLDISIDNCCHPRVVRDTSSLMPETPISMGTSFVSSVTEEKLLAPQLNVKATNVDDRGRSFRSSDDPMMMLVQRSMATSSASSRARSFTRKGTNDEEANVQFMPV